MKKVRRNRILYLVMQLVFMICSVMFFLILLVCEPYDRIPVGGWFGACVFMTVQMHRARKNAAVPPPDEP